MELRYSIQACRPMCTLEKEIENIGSIWSRVTCLALPLAAAQVFNIELLEILEVFGT
jgi:hypothetical protein